MFDHAALNAVIQVLADRFWVEESWRRACSISKVKLDEVIVETLNAGECRLSESRGIMK